jgi:hypothetical protein
MRHLQTIVTLLLVVLTSLASFAKDPILQPGDNAPAGRGIPIASNADGSFSATTQFGDRVQLAIDKSDIAQADPSFFRRLRQEITKLEMAEAQKNQGEGTMHVLRHVKANFVPDSITFAIAGGLVYFTQLQIATKSDPALMVKHLESLKDPIAHISFGAFMVANGLYIDMRTRGLDPMTKQLAMKTLTYKGLAVGSFASSLTADLLVTFKECTKSWINNKNDAASHSACDYAYKQWTFRNKFVQYAPQILSLLVAQKATEVVEGVAHAGGRVVKPGVKLLESAGIKLFKITAANIDMVFGGGTWWIKGIRWAGKLTKFTMFLAVDHFVAPHVMRAGNDLIQPVFFDVDAMALGKALARGSKYNWDSEKAAKANESFNTMPKDILNFTERMSQWRMHLNAKAEANLSGWLDVTSKLLHQVDYSKNYYLKYVENLFDTMNRQHLVNQGEFNDAPDRAWALERRYPLRLLPLYGVKSGKDFEGVPENDMYLAKPFLLEPLQSEMVQKVAVDFMTKAASLGLPAHTAAEVKSLIGPLTQKISPIRQGIQLDKINRRLKMVPAIRTTDTDKAIYAALVQFRTALGDPKPQLKEGSGLNMAFDTNVGNYESAKAAGFDLKEKNYRFAKATDLMLFKMICGDKQAQIKEGMLTGINFYPPRLVNYQDELSLCKNTGLGENTTSDTLHDWKIESDGKVYDNPTQFIMARIYPTVLGDWRDFSKAQKGIAFDQWWVKSVLPNLQGELKKLDQRFGQVVKEADQQLNNQKAWYDKVIDNVFDWRSYMKDKMLLDNNVGDNLRFEFEFYLTVMKTVLLEEKVAAKKFNQEYILEIAQRARARRDVVPSVSSEAETARLKTKYNWLFGFVKEAKREEITNLDEFRDKLLLPGRAALPAYQNYWKQRPEEMKKNPKIAQSLAGYETGLKRLTHEMKLVRMNEFEMNYKAFMALLRKPNVKFDEMVAAKEKLYTSNTVFFGDYKQMAELVGLENLPGEVQILLSLANGLEALEMEVNRFLLMKVKLADRLELDMSQLNTFLKHRSLSAPPKKGSASPHNTGAAATAPDCTTILANGVCKKN